MTVGGIGLAYEINAYEINGTGPRTAMITSSSRLCKGNPGVEALSERLAY